MFTLRWRLLQKQAPAALSSEELRDMQAAFEALHIRYCDVGFPLKRRSASYHRQPGCARGLLLR
jgi:hypothetical protein